MKVSFLTIKDTQGNVIAEAELTFPTGEPQRALDIYNSMVGEAAPIAIDPRVLLKAAVPQEGLTITQHIALMLTEQEKVPA